jgi:hypothetical protein
MKWRIKNPAPIGPRLTKWGDYHFGASLAKCLRALGEQVDTDFDPQWETDAPADVVLVLRGKHTYTPRPGPLHVMWNISHPGDVSLDEYRGYDLVFIASEAHAQQVARQISGRVRPLLQCTDTELFRADTCANGAPRAGYIFVGNSRNAERPCVPWALETGFPLRVWGRMWSRWIDTRKHLVAEYIDNEALGALYRGARATLNDHWPDMKTYGFINNRIFDALACGLPVISDYHEALHRLFPNEILYYRTREDLHECLRELILNYPCIKARVDRLQPLIAEEFSFAKRAGTLVDAVYAHRGVPRPEHA